MRENEKERFVTRLADERECFIGQPVGQVFVRGTAGVVGKTLAIRYLARYLVRQEIARRRTGCARHNAGGKALLRGSAAVLAQMPLADISRTIPRIAQDFCKGHG